MRDKMADLGGLIRYRKHILDEKQKFLGELYREAESLLQKRENLLSRLEAEKQAIEPPEGSMDGAALMAVQGFAEFLHKTKSELDKVKQQEGLLDTRIQIAIDDMRERFGDLKKIEITQDRRLEALRKAIDKRENALYEEIGIQMHQLHES